MLTANKEITGIKVMGIAMRRLHVTPISSEENTG